MSNREEDRRVQKRERAIEGEERQGSRENDGEARAVDGAREGDQYCRRIHRLRSIGWQGGRPAIT